jgi:hypothetical protein
MRTPEDKAALAKTVLSFMVSGLLSDKPVSDDTISDKSPARAAEQP